MPRTPRVPTSTSKTAKDNMKANSPSTPTEDLPSPSVLTPAPDTTAPSADFGSQPGNTSFMVFSSNSEAASGSGTQIPTPPTTGFTPTSSRDTSTGANNGAAILYVAIGKSHIDTGKYYINDDSDGQKEEDKYNPASAKVILILILEKTSRKSFRGSLVVRLEQETPRRVEKYRQS
ncbi:hypothetical protein BGZ65_000941 [Modicella reniformis]|uniref:Uncharacterized protein n=1 Tax=Modicella reniformis TaxID=1440133 RepID=A0A9P6LU41_9FUNG|nr:hypothetical protein BGZ65_000941 [Modicella reniformis]